MTDAQVLTLALAVIVPLSLLIYSNSRITDAKEASRASITEAKETLRAEMQTLRAHMDASFERLQADLKEFYKLIADRVKRIERPEDKK